MLHGETLSQKGKEKNKQKVIENLIDLQFGV
jgi:hypothetical protein